MIKPLFAILLSACSLGANAQTNAANAPTTMPYGKIDKADLEMTACDFEKDASAEILFDKGTVYFDQEYNLIYDRHIRIKVFNDDGKNEANIKIDYYGGDRTEFLSNVQGETINMNNGAVQIEKIDKKLIYSKALDKNIVEVSFAFPDVKPGSVIEYKYTLSTPYLDDFPDWYFQTSIPTRYSELNTSIPNFLYYKNLVMTHQPYVKNTDEVKSMANIPSIDNEPFMTCINDNAQRILYELKSINLPNYIKGFSDNWQKVGEEELGFDDFGGQFRRKLEGEDDILNKAKALTTSDQKIELIFNYVKNQMKWNEQYRRFTNDGTAEAWSKKIGNSTEVNLILYHLLKKAGVNAYPLLTSTRKHGKVNPAYPSRLQFNTAVAYVPIDTVNYYILDATDKFNTYREIPVNLLNNFGLYLDKDSKKSDLVFIQKTTPVREVSMISAQITPDGKMTGSMQINSFSYNRLTALKKYKEDGEQKYMKMLSYGDNNLKISELKFDNMDVDSLPLTQSFTFNQDLTGSDETYIYFKPNHFAAEYTSQFLSEKRLADIDFGHITNDVLSASFKLPSGYKVDALPKSVSMSLPDNSITFKRVTGEQDGTVVVRYVLFIKKSLYFKENYPEFHEFFKKLNEMLNEQVVLKKS